MARSGLQVRRWLKVNTRPQVQAAQERALTNVANLIRDVARIHVTRQTGNLRQSIEVTPVERSKSGRSLIVYVRVDEERAPYAWWQEAGTGLRYAGKGGPHGWIVPKTARVMVFDSHKRYSGAFITNVLVARGLRKVGRKLKPDRKLDVYKHFASRVRGNRPQWYMKQARESKQVKQFYEQTMQDLTKVYLK